MKKSEIKITTTLVEILHAPYINAWEHFCSKYGFNEWCINEGRAVGEDEVQISLEDAEFYGIIEDDSERF